MFNLNFLSGGSAPLYSLFFGGASLPIQYTWRGKRREFSVGGFFQEEREIFHVENFPGAERGSFLITN